MRSLQPKERKAFAEVFPPCSSLCCCSRPHPKSGACDMNSKNLQESQFDLHLFQFFTPLRCATYETLSQVSSGQQSVQFGPTAILFMPWLLLVLLLIIELPRRRLRKFRRRPRKAARFCFVPLHVFLDPAHRTADAHTLV